MPTALSSLRRQHQGHPADGVRGDDAVLGAGAVRLRLQERRPDQQCPRAGSGRLQFLPGGCLSYPCSASMDDVGCLAVSRGLASFAAWSFPSVTDRSQSFRVLLSRVGSDEVTCDWHILALWKNCWRHVGLLCSGAVPALQVGLEFLQKTIIDQKTGSNNFYIIYQVRTSAGAAI